MSQISSPDDSTTAPLQTHPAGRLAPRAWRPHGAVRRLRHAGAVRPDRRPRRALPRRRHGRASALPRAGRRCSTSRTWARPCCTGAGAAAALERLVPGDITGLKSRPPALHAADQRGRRHHRRPDGRQLSATTACSWSSTPAARTSTSPTLPPACPTVDHGPAGRSRPAGPARPGGRRRHAAPRAGGGRAALHGRRHA